MTVPAKSQMCGTQWLSNRNIDNCYRLISILLRVFMLLQFFTFLQCNTKDEHTRRIVTNMQDPVVGWSKTNDGGSGFRVQVRIVRI